MSYTTMDIAQIDEPNIVSLSGQTNFVKFTGIPPLSQALYKATIKVNITNAASAVPTKTELVISEPNGTLHIFRGNTDPELSGGSVFNVTPYNTVNAENLRAALMSDEWIASNFEVQLPFNWSGLTPELADTIHLISKGYGADYNIGITAPGNIANVAYTINVLASSVKNDSITGEASTAIIELDVFTDTGVFLGVEDRETLGTFAVSLQKTYTDSPVWFELNNIFRHLAGYNRPPNVPGWFDTGTLRSYRFTARVISLITATFYQSDVLYVLTGYGPALEPIDVTPYVYEGFAAIPLTNKPKTFYVPGSTAFFNFLFSDPLRGVSPITSFALMYSAFSTSGVFLGTHYGQPLDSNDAYMSNTARLTIDDVIAEYPNAGQVSVTLVRNTGEDTYISASTPIEFTIRPACFHTVTEFIFLNQLGGWDAFNFDAEVVEEVKPEASTFRKTITPDFKKGDSIETIYTAEVNRVFSVTGAPVNDATADWLKEIAASRAVFDGDGNYIIIDEFTLKVSDATKNMQVPTIKYHLSDSYTND